MSFGRAFAVFGVAAMLAGCAGGGTSGGGNGNVSPPAAPSSANMTKKSVQRADVQSSLAGVQAMREAVGPGTSAFVRQRNALKAAVAKARRAGMFGILHPMATATSDPNCNGSGSSESTAPGSNGSVVITVSTYYDSACTDIESVIVWTATQSGSTVNGPATVTLYSKNGTVTETASAQVQFIYSDSTLSVVTGISILMTSIVDNGKNQGELGVGCNIASATTISCGVAVAADVYAAQIEEGANVSFTATHDVERRIDVDAGERISKFARRVIDRSGAVPGLDDFARVHANRIRSDQRLGNRFERFADRCGYDECGFGRY